MPLRGTNAAGRRSPESESTSSRPRRRALWDYFGLVARGPTTSALHIMGRICAASGITHYFSLVSYCYTARLNSEAREDITAK